MQNTNVGKSVLDELNSHTTDDNTVENTGINKYWNDFIAVKTKLKEYVAAFGGEIGDQTKSPQEFKRELAAAYKQIIGKIFKGRFEDMNEKKGYRYCNFSTMPLN